jgi:hypothetical protein
LPLNLLRIAENLGASGILAVNVLLRLNHFAAAQAGGANAHALGGCAHAGVYGAKIDVPAPLGDVVGVADAVSGLRLLTADFTLL